MAKRVFFAVFSRRRFQLGAALGRSLATSIVPHFPRWECDQGAQDASQIRYATHASPLTTKPSAPAISGRIPLGIRTRGGEGILLNWRFGEANP